jgi:hypothetical protein
MLLMGDEVRRSQGGNNNAYCQNTEISWFDWTLIEKHADVLRFVKKLIALRMSRNLPVERLDLTLNELLRRQPVQWHGVKLHAPDWSDESHTLAATVPLLSYPLLLHIMINAYWGALDFEVPALDAAQGCWQRCVDTYRDPPGDICDWADAGRCPNARGLNLFGPTALRCPAVCQNLETELSIHLKGWRRFSFSKLGHSRIRQTFRRFYPLSARIAQIAALLMH